MRPETNLFHRHILTNGITLLLQQNSSVDLVAGRIFFKNAGSIWEKRVKGGLFNLLSRVITKGTEQYSSQEIADKIESIGASLGTDATNDYFLLSLKAVTSDFAEILELASEILQKPTFPENEIDLERHLTLESIRSSREQPFNVAYSQLRESMYQEHPYAISVLGQEDSLKSLTRSDLQTCHQNYIRPEHCVISLSGNISFDEALQLIEKFFAPWQNNYSSAFEPLKIAEVINNPQYIYTHKDTQQEIVMLGYFASSIFSEDYPALKLLNTYLGSGLSSRLFVELREKRGLAYDVSAMYPPRQDLSQFIFYIGTAPENTQTAKLGLQEEAERLVKDPLSEEELQNAKNKLLGKYALSKQTNSEVAQINGWYETIGLGVEFDSKFNEIIEQVTPKNAQEVAQKYFSQPYISQVGPQEIDQ